MPEKEKVSIIKDGKEVECDILITFDCPETQKAYIAYTDHSKDEIGNDNIYVASYTVIDGKEKIENVTEQFELDMVNRIVDEVLGGNN